MVYFDERGDVGGPEMRFLPGQHRRLGTGVALGVFVTGLISVVPATSATESAHWAIVPSPNPGTNGNFPSGVSCVSARSCTAVGELDNISSSEQTLIESWNGTTWSVVPSPNHGPFGSILNAVSCVSSTSCWAVGYSNIGDEQTLIESWNGTTWSVVPSPDVGRALNALYGVSCISATSCRAVGFYNTNDDPSTAVTRTLVETWNGRRWFVAPSPNKRSRTSLFFGVSCISATSCRAVGYYETTTGSEQTLIESWNGARWFVSSSPDPGTGFDVLHGVSCVSATSCQAVGVYLNGLTGQSLVESWDGTTWSAVPSPNPGIIDNELAGVSCVSARSCWAVGEYVSVDFNRPQTLVESLHGTTWSIESSPNNATIGNVLSGVSCVSGGSCEAVGSSFGFFGQNGQTLVEARHGGKPSAP